MNIDIKGIGWITCAGTGSGTTAPALDLRSGNLPPLKSRALLGEVHKRFGRFDDYTKIGFGAIALALRDAGLEHWDSKRPIGLVVSTLRGCLAMDEAYFKTAATDGGSLASPNLFAYTLPNCMLGEAAIQFGLTGPSFVVDDATPGHLAGIHTAADLLSGGLCDTVVAGWCDVASALTGTGHQEVGTVFVVMRRGDHATPSLQWQQGELLVNRQPVQALAQLATFDRQRSA